MRSVTFVGANQVKLLECGTEFFPALINAIEAAQYEILFETYIYAEDKVANEVTAALVRAAQRGVKVRVIVDWFGTGHRTAKRLANVFNEGGVHYRVFNPWFRRGVARTHRKIAVVDREVAFVGGINVNDDMFCDYEPHAPLSAPRWDFAVEVRGPLVARVHVEAQAQWARVGHMNLIHRLGLFREMRKQPEEAGERPMQAAFVVRDNLRNRRTIQRAYLLALGRARRSVLVVNPYFAPGRKLREALTRAAQRGVDVRLLIGVGEFKLQDAVAHSFYPKLLAAGVKIYEYHKTQLHGKVMVVDDDWATVGSSNCDGFSLFVNQEANVVVKDAAFAATVRRCIERGIAEAQQVVHEEFKQVGWARRASYGLAYRLYKLAMRIFAIGYA